MWQSYFSVGLPANCSRNFNFTKIWRARNFAKIVICDICLRWSFTIFFKTLNCWAECEHIDLIKEIRNTRFFHIIRTTKFFFHFYQNLDCHAIMGIFFELTVFVFNSLPQVTKFTMWQHISNLLKMGNVYNSTVYFTKITHKLNSYLEIWQWKPTLYSVKLL